MLVENQAGCVENFFSESQIAMFRKIFSSENLKDTFDEGGIAMRSRYCPVRQYNKDKPNKYRVDFFILADASYYFIY